MNHMGQIRRIIDIATPILAIIKMYSKVLDIKGLAAIDNWCFTKMLLAKVNKHPYLTSLCTYIPSLTKRSTRFIPMKQMSPSFFSMV